MTTVKLNNKRLVPTHRFNLAAGAPSKVMHTIRSSSKTSQSESGVTMVAHPILRSIPLETSDQAREALPVVHEEKAGPLYPDRYDENVRWYLSTYKLVKPSDLEAPLLLVRDIGVDEKGERVFSGTLTLRFYKVKSEKVSQALQQAKKEIPSLEAREIPLIPKEIELYLTYLKDGQEKTDTYTAPYDAGKNQAQFELRGGALQLAYSLVAGVDSDGAGVGIIGDFNSWVSVRGDDETQAAAAAEAVEASQVLAEEALTESAAVVAKVRPRLANRQRSVTVRMRDHRDRQVHRDNIRDHRRRHVGRASRGGTSTAQERTKGSSRAKVRVRDHRSRGIRRRVRDHRGSQDHQDRKSSRDDRNERKRHVAKARRGKSATTRERDQKIAKQRQIIRQEQVLHVSCHQFRRMYQFEAEPDQNQIFGCEPPWGEGFQPGAHYRKLGRSELPLPDELWRQVTIYESLNEVAVFLLVPKSYSLARTTDTFAPTLSMTTVLDPEDTMQSKVVFDFVVTPELLPFSLWQVRVTLSTYLNEQVGVDRQPDLRFPTTLVTPPELEWNDPFTQITQFIADGDAYVLTAEANSVGEAHAVVKRIKGEQQSLSGQFVFEPDDSLQVSSSIIVDLNRTTAPALEIELAADSGFAHLTNQCESPMLVSQLLFYRQEPPETRVQPLPQVHKLPPEEKLSVLIPEGTYDGVAAEYDIEEDTSGSLSELRVDVSLLEVGIGVDTDLQPQERFQVTSDDSEVKLEAVHVALDAAGTGEDSVTLVTEEDAFATDTISLLVPLDRYLEPDARVFRYRATFAFDNNAELITDWLEHNYGQNPNLTIRRQELQHLLSSDEQQ